jgi:hypothetical protein
MCTFTARSLMNGDEAARNAPCTICSIRILNIRKCKQRCLSTFVTLVMMKGIVLILLSNLGTRIFLRGVGYDAPGFKLASLTLTTESAESNLLTLVKPRSTWVITLKTSPTNPNGPLDQVNTNLWSTLGQRHGQTPLTP